MQLHTTQILTGYRAVPRYGCPVPGQARNGWGGPSSRSDGTPSRGWGFSRSPVRAGILVWRVRRLAGHVPSGCPSGLFLGDGRCPCCWWWTWACARLSSQACPAWRLWPRGRSIWRAPGPPPSVCESCGGRRPLRGGAGVVSRPSTVFAAPRVRRRRGAHAGVGPGEQRPVGDGGEVAGEPGPPEPVGQFGQQLGHLGYSPRA